MTSLYLGSLYKDKKEILTSLSTSSSRNKLTMACKCNCISPEIDLKQNKLHAITSTYTLKMETTSIFFRNSDQKQE